ncbi:MAG: phosphonate metabolism protein/1,5-bisphosphokinase (PRPP-forming) PhnN [Methylococcales bacterium]|nr:phosphonate metabolism protein/1,5-bisphosphokinase (PRPP-forming) PhnN [Methylococcales bacterium]MDP3839911.1 phosphonate metabolism protein/1,5-bisphosphokinase (PRPP-forming) PhnN [Methylococcales bacterium]
MPQGQLFYVIGPSGSGKDTLMQYARSKLSEREKIIFAHRYITRKPELVGENHIYLSEAEFAAKERQDFFAMQWDSHELRYGIGKEINFWLAQGFNVVINGSREYLPIVLEKEPQIRVILVRTANDVLRERLKNRQRETADEIEKRLERATLFNRINHPNVTLLDNNGSLEESGAAFIALLMQDKNSHDLVS